ncbi:MAG: cyclic nucleotide-binding domain-containing protein [Proteobacteria bacterium]|nr:cyclic nucleotide-binding domain-containing protein [Pseudomonadota bacterium]
MNGLEQFEKGGLFDGLDEAEEKLITEKFQGINISKGEYVFKENDVGDTLYIVEKGTISLKKLIINDYEKTLFVAREGAVFGEFSFIDGKERSASALAEYDSVILRLKRADFNAFIQEHPLTGTKLYNNLLIMTVKRLRHTNEAYRDAILWGLEATGTQNLNFQNIITENINIRLELTNNRVLEGRIIQLEQSEAGYEIVIADKSGDLSLVPYHAINTVSIAKE